MQSTSLMNVISHSSSIWTMLSSLLLLSGAGLLTYALRRIPSKIGRFLLARFTVSLTMHTADPTSTMISQSFFTWYMNSAASRHMRRFSYDTGWKDRERNMSGSGPRPNSGVFAPGVGIHFFMFKGTLAWFTRERSANSLSPNTHEVEIYFAGTRRRIIEDFLEEIKPKVDRRDVPIYTLGRKYGEAKWAMSRVKRKRQLDSVVIRHDIKDMVVNTIDDFYKREHWYLERGITYKLSFILHGQPGTGKSSFIFALASHFNRPVYMVNMNALNDTTFQSVLDEVGENAFIVIEDVDVGTATAEREEEPVTLEKVVKNGEEKKQAISMSTILNTLDGIASLTGNVIFLSTNHLQNLDRALTRRGRIDHIIEIPPMRHEEIQEYASLMYEKEVFPVGIHFKDMPGSDVQGIFLDHKEDFDGFVADMLKHQ